MLDERVQAFLSKNHAAAMVTLRRDGTPHVARVGVALVDGQLWSSATQARLRTRNLRRDPRSTLFVFDTTDLANAAQWLALESRVTILEGPDVPELSVRLFRVMQGRPDADTILWSGQERGIEEFRRMMVDEQRLIYQFDVQRAYGLY